MDPATKSSSSHVSSSTATTSSSSASLSSSSSLAATASSLGVLNDQEQQSLIAAAFPWINTTTATTTANQQQQQQLPVAAASDDVSSSVSSSSPTPSRSAQQSVAQPMIVDPALFPFLPTHYHPATAAAASTSLLPVRPPPFCLQPSPYPPNLFFPGLSASYPNSSASTPSFPSPYGSSIYLVPSVTGDMTSAVASSSSSSSSNLDPEHRQQQLLSSVCASMGSRGRSLFTDTQLLLLESRYQKNANIQGRERDEFARDIGLSSKQVKIWFQNRRYKAKRKIGTQSQRLFRQKQETDMDASAAQTINFLYGPAAYAAASYFTPPPS